jgi:hypothetical protein
MAGIYASYALGEMWDIYIKVDDSGAKPKVWVPLVHAGILAKIEALE